MSKRQRQKLVYVATAAAMLAMIGGYALAATSVTTLSPQQSSNVTQSPSPGAFTGVGTVTSEQLVVLTAGMTAAATAGTETAGAIGLSGAPTALATCATPPCTAANFISAKPATETAGDFGEQIALTITQPAGAAANSVGFDIAFSITMTVGVTTSTVTALAYIATGTTGVVTTSAVAVFVYIDLNTTSAPSITSVQVIFNQCASATSCP